MSFLRKSLMFDKFKHTKFPCNKFNDQNIKQSNIQFAMFIFGIDLGICVGKRSRFSYQSVV